MQDILDRLGGTRRVMILVTGIAAAMLIFAFSRWATAPEWVAVYSGLPLESVGKMTEQLDQAGIAYRLDAGGSNLLVAAGEVARARVVLAKANLPSSGRPGLELFDQPNWGQTDFTQRVNYRRALEGELERTIGKMRGIEAAQVHLSLHETSSFRRSTDRPPEASVMLRLRSGARPPADVVQGIAQLVASSVDGVEAGHVTVVDDAGRLLSQPADDGSLAGLTTHQLGMQREVEDYLESKAGSLVSQIVGAGNAHVEVAAAINFDKVERTTQQVDPDKQSITTEQKYEVTPGTDGGASSSNTATAYENSRSVETFSGAIGNIRRLSVAVLVNDRPVAGDSTAGRRGAPRSAADLAQIETLVRNAVGFDSSRGDVITVASVPFDAAAPAVLAPFDSTSKEETSVWSTVQSVQRPVLGLLGLVLMAVVALAALKSLKTPGSALAPARVAAGAGPSYVPQLSSGGDVMPQMPPRPAAIPAFGLNESVVKQRVVATVDQQPDQAARLVRSWLKEA